MTTVKLCDMRAAGVCADARDWFKANGLDWRAFVRDGIDAEALRKAKGQQANVERTIRAAEKREAAHGRR